MSNPTIKSSTDAKPVVTEAVKTEREIELEERRKFFHGEPLLNVLSKEEFQSRVEKVFQMVSNTLSASFGAYGAPAIISNYPYTHVTKDGYTIFKNMTFDAECGSLVDCTIANMIGDICGRLNYKVGDGTTTAIVATNSIYQAYYARKEYFENNFILPRDVMKSFTEVKDELVERIQEKATVFTNDHEEMVEAIRKIVNISSNGDETITNMIGEIYDKIGYPSISVELSKDGVTRYSITEGYRGQVFLTDKLYVNSDDGFSDHKNIDVIIFDHKVETECYQKIIAPLYNLSRQMGREFLVIAPAFSDTTMQNVIRKDMLDEYKREKKISLILCTCKAVTTTAKRNLADLAMLLDTTIIDRQLERTILDDVAKHPEDMMKFLDYFDYDRNIEGMAYLVTKEDDPDSINITTKEELEDGVNPYETNESAILVGFAGNCRLGVDYSVFSDFHYNKDLYDRYLDDAKSVMDEMIDKYAKLGTFNFEVTEAMKRFNALQLKNATIEAGGDSELSKAMLKDSIEDAVRAADSAYNHGYIQGCNLTTILEIQKMKEEMENDESIAELSVDEKKPYDVKYVILNILLEGFTVVYLSVLRNAYTERTGINIEFASLADDETELTTAVNEVLKNAYGIKENSIDQEVCINTIKRIGAIVKQFESEEEYEKFIASEKEKEEGREQFTLNPIYLIIEQSVKNEQVFDLDKKEFSNDIINSAATDIEVLTSIVDLSAILITGNQLVMTGKHNF